MDKKKRNIIILIVALVLLISSTTVCLVNVLGNRDKGAGNKVNGASEEMVADTEEKTTSATTEKVTTEKATAEEMTTSEKTTTESSTSSKPKDTEEVTTETVVNTTQSTEAPSTTQSAQATTQAPATTEKEKVWHPPVTEMVWIVDEEAYTETIPVYETVPAVRCHGCGQIFYSQESIDAHGDESAYDNCGGYSSDYQQVQVGTTEVYHEEEGHWESVVVQEGYWE